MRESNAKYRKNNKARVKARLKKYSAEHGEELNEKNRKYRDKGRVRAYNKNAQEAFAKRTAPRICAFCNEEYKPLRKEQKFCSISCSRLARRKT